MKSLSWSEILVNNLTGYKSDVNQLSEVQIDELLTWASGFSTSNDHLTKTCIKKAGSKKIAQKKILNFLDVVLFNEPIDYVRLFGRHQENKVNRKVLKKRHSQLVKIFHPDRGLVDEVWLTKRMEKVNSAYNLVLKNPKLLAPSRRVNQTKRVAKVRNNNTFTKNKKLKSKKAKVKGFKNLLYLLRVNYFKIRKKLPKHLKLRLMIVVSVVVFVYLLIMVAGIYLE